MANSRVNAAINALVTLARTALTDVPVYDGPDVGDGAALEAVFIGYDGDPTSEEPSVSFTQEWAGLGNNAKNEAFTITCGLLVWSGDTGTGTPTDSPWP